MTFNGGIKPIWMHQLDNINSMADIGGIAGMANLGGMYNNDTSIYPPHLLPPLLNNLKIEPIKKISVDVNEQSNNNKEVKKPKKKKEKIPSAVRKIVWNTYIGKDKPIGNCLCCDAEEISNTNFECGHIKSEKNGGEVTIENLRPICGHCNKSIGGNNMDEFMDRYKIKKPSNWNGINSN